MGCEDRREEMCSELYEGERVRTFELVLPSGGALSDARIGTTWGSHP